MPEQAAADKAGGYITQLLFNDGTPLALQPDDIVVFVGPNNAGKSQSLRDIYALSGGKPNTVIVNNATFHMEDVSVRDALEALSAGEPDGVWTHYHIFGEQIDIMQNEPSLNQLPNFGRYRPAFVINLTTEKRLQICDPPDTINRDERKKHPIHYAAFDRTYQDWLKARFEEAFGTRVLPDTQGRTISLRMGNEIPVETRGYGSDLVLRYGEALAKYPQIQNQGDGIRSFTGILLYLMMRNTSFYLIDEPESFLHPPQARIMGQILGRTLSERQRQAFLSTHSEDIINGLLDICPEHVKIVRITRKDDKNTFAFLENKAILEAWTDPLLKYSNILSGLFHKTVVLCESDADCKLYALVEDYTKRSEGRYAETHYIHCGGKHRMARIARALRSLKLDIRLVPDIDVLHEKEVFKGIAEAFGIDWSTIEQDYTTVIGSLPDQDPVDRAATLRQIEAIFSACQESCLSEKEIEQIKEVLKAKTPWKKLKKQGRTFIPAGGPRDAFDRLDGVLRAHGVYIVPVGELESFVPVGGKEHGPGWVNKALEKFPDFGADVYRALRDFIKSLSL